MPGFGRGPPGPALPPGRGIPGRGGIAPGATGLVTGPPGRGTAGRVAGLLPPTPNGLLPTRGAGRGPGRGAEPPGAGGAAGAEVVEVEDAAGVRGSANGVGLAGACGDLAGGATVTGVEGAETAGPVGPAGAVGPVGPGIGAPRPATDPVDGASVALAAVVTVGSATGAAFFAGTLTGATGTSAGTGNASRRRRATGGSTVDDALLTYSPCSLSLARTSLLVTPSSLASAETRDLPGTGLLRRTARQPARSD